MPQQSPDDLDTCDKRLLREYARRMEKSGEPPSYGELATRLGIAKNTVMLRLRRLETLGYLRPRPVTVMRLKLTPKAHRAL